MTTVTPMPKKTADYDSRLAAAVNQWMALPESPNDLLDLDDTVMITETPAGVPWPKPRVAEPVPTLLAEIVAALPVGLVVLDFKGCVKLWTDSAAMIFGWSSAEVIGAPPPFVSPAQSMDHKAVIEQLRSGYIGGERIVSRLRKDGEMRTLAMHATQTISGDFVLTFREIVPSRVATVADTMSPDRPMNRLETLGRMVSSVSHDFNNVLGAICGSAELLSERATNGERDLIEVIRLAGKHAAGLTRRLVQFAKPSPTTTSVMDLSDVVKELLPLIQALVPASVKVTHQLTPNLPGTSAEATVLEQVILNLATNAGQAMPRGGNLRFRTDAVTLALPKLNLMPGQYVVLTIADTGTGFDDAARSRLFEPFFSTKTTGTGLGLTTVKELVTQAGGSIELDSETGRGSAFRVYFPAVSNPLPVVDGNGKRALVAEDDAAIRELMKRVLESVGFDVSAATSGDEARQLASWMRDDLDLLVTDVVMPGGGGRRLVDQLRAEWPHLAVVYASGYPPLDEVLPPATVFISKPFAAKHLLAAVQSAMNRVPA